MDITEASNEKRYAVKHEVRNSLTAVSGYVQLLKSKITKNQQIEPRWIHSLDRETSRLIERMKELLEPTP